MDTRKKFILAGTAALAVAACSDATSPNSQTAVGAVYVQTNAAAKNEVVAYSRSATGALALLGTFSTGGRGTDMAKLGSQGSIISSADGQFLLVTNVGSNDVSVFRITNAGLTLLSTTASGGTMPESITLRGSLVYVMNAGGSGNITAFRLGTDGTLTAIAASTRQLSGSVTGNATPPAPAEVAFSPDGGTLVVSEKMTGMIDTYTVGADGLATGPTVHASSGETPFGFAFRSDGVFVITEAHNARPGEAAASSYSLTGGFKLVSGSVPDTQTDVCWTVISQDGKYAYITNFGAGTISSYSIGADGHIVLMQAVAARTAAAQGPRDEALSSDSRYLYAIDIGFADASTRAVNAFQVQADGSLIRVPSHSPIQRLLVWPPANVATTSKANMEYAKSRAALRADGNLEAVGAVFIRYALVAVLLWIGALKLTAYEAQGVYNHASHSPLLAWGYNFVSVRTFAVILGVVEWTFAILIAIRPFSARLSAIGSLGAIVMFCTTLTFLATTPGVWQPQYGFPFLSPSGQFLLKDLVLLGAAIWTAGESLRAAREGSWAQN